MKKAVCLFTFAFLLFSMFSCIPNEDVPGVENDEANDTGVKCEHILTIPAPNNLYVKAQGATFDGEYYYVAFINNYLPYETAIIVKTDKNGNEVMRSAELPLDHANSITILENGNLMVAHCQSPDGHYYRYSILDKDTFEIIETKDLNEPFMSIAYCKEKECFVSVIENDVYVICGDYDNCVVYKVSNLIKD